MRKREYIRRGAGFTLLELLIAVALMLIVMLMLHYMFMSANTMYLRAAARIDIYAQARTALDIMEQDLMRMRIHADEDSIHLRSLDPANWLDPKAAQESGIFTRLDDWDKPDPVNSYDIRELMSFTGMSTWWNESTQRFETGPATIVYYLRKRPDSSDRSNEGAYLVRRVIQQRGLASLAAIGRGDQALTPLTVTEDEIASFIYSASCYVDDQAAFLYAMQTGSFGLDIMPLARKDYGPNSEWLWTDERLSQGGAGRGIPAADSNAPMQVLPEPKGGERLEFGGRFRGATDMGRDFVSSRWNYPSVVMVELTMIDPDFERFDRRTGIGTYRSFSRAIYIPVSRPLFQLDWRDTQLMMEMLSRARR